MSMASYYYITDSCKIRNRTVTRNNKVLFTGSSDQPVSFLTEVYKHFEFSYPKFYKMDSLCKLGYLASEILFHQKERHFNGEDFGILLYNSGSSIDTDRNHQQSINDRNAYFPSPSVFVYTLPNIVIGEICIRHKIFGESAFFITEEFDSEAIYSYAKLLFDENIIQLCITGWVECNGGYYDCTMLMVEKSTVVKEGFVIFDPRNIREIYSQ